MALRERLAEICEGLPEVFQRPGGEHGRHVGYLVRKKTFAYFTDDHHGDSRLALSVKAPPGPERGGPGGGRARALLRPRLSRYRGWVGLYLDREPPDWDEVAELFTEAYRMTAPKSLIARMD